MLQINARQASRQNFSKYGKFVSRPTTEPTAQSKEFKFWSDLTHYHIKGDSEIGICTIFPQSKLTVASMERHTGSPEILIPGDHPFLVPLLLDGEESERTGVFYVDIGQAIVIDRGVWHGACLPVSQKESSYFVIFKQGTPEQDVEKKDINPVEVIQ
ncbi:MAG: ureidoglycolate lyase [Candidatus Marinimicrobia bacterium]|nr:ureidoglycolate lyase [Candidatus Neomarinimicrobiota bacterium]